MNLTFIFPSSKILSDEVSLLILTLGIQTSKKLDMTTIPGHKDLIYRDIAEKEIQSLYLEDLSNKNTSEENDTYAPF